MILKYVNFKHFIKKHVINIWRLIDKKWEKCYSLFVKKIKRLPFL